MSSVGCQFVYNLGCRLVLVDLKCLLIDLLSYIYILVGWEVIVEAFHCLFVLFFICCYNYGHLASFE